MPSCECAFRRAEWNSFAVILVITLFVSACGGGSAGNVSTGTGGSGGGGTQSNGPSSGEYLWEVSSTQPAMSYAIINTTAGALGAPVATGAQLGDPENYQSIAVAPSGQFLYSFYWSFSELHSFQMSGPGIQLQQTSLLLLPYEDSVVMHPSGKFLFVVEDGFPPAIQEVLLDATTGGTSLGSSTSENADLRTAVLDSTGTYLLVNDLTGGRIFVFQVNQSTGALSAAPNSPFTLPSNEQATYLAFGGSSGSQFLYADLYSGGVAAFSFNSSAGALTVVPGSPFQTASDAPDYICVDPSGKYLYGTNSQDGAIDGLAINPTTGALSPVPGTPFATAASSDTIAIDASGKYLYVTNYENSEIFGFGLNASTGSLSALAGSPFASVPNPVGLTMMNIP